jgi:integrase/recombinase XerD
LLLNFCDTVKKIKLEKISLADFNVDLILDFLDFLENERANAVSSRNQRLAILKCFFRYLASQQPCFLDTCQKVSAIANKKAALKVIESLSKDEVKTIITIPNIATEAGARDQFLLSLLYNTGARVQEICDLKVGDIDTEGLPQVRLTGKGKKQRIIPLWQETLEAMRHYLSFRENTQGDEHLILNARKLPITRFGINYIIKKYTELAMGECPSLDGKNVTPHTFRHTNALHLIQSGVDVLIVKEWLSHKDLKTTIQYVNIDIEMKRKGLALCPAPIASSANQKPTWKEPGIIKLLKSFCCVM